MITPMDETAACLVESLAAQLWRTTRGANQQPTMRYRRLGVSIGLALHGLRTVEISRAQVRHLAVRSATLYIASAKHGPHRTVQLDPEFAAALATLSNRLDRRGPLIPTCRRTFVDPADISQRISRWLAHEVGPFTAHSLRYAAAMRCYTETLDVFAVQILLGHRDTRTTLHYLRRYIPVAAGSPKWPPRFTPPALKLGNRDTQSTAEAVGDIRDTGWASLTRRYQHQRNYRKRHPTPTTPTPTPAP
jgi:integrase